MIQYQEASSESWRVLGICVSSANTVANVNLFPRKENQKDWLIKLKNYQKEKWNFDQLNKTPKTLHTTTL